MTIGINMLECGEHMLETNKKICVKYINWCYKKHLDINNLIPIGLAIDATRQNVY